MIRPPLSIFLSVITATLAAAAADNEWQTVTAKFNPKTNQIVYNDVKFAGPEVLDHTHFAFNTIMTVVCVICAALASGLTMGLVSLDDFDLRILMESSEDDVPDPADKAEMRKEKQAAIKLHPLISRHHLLLVTLLLVNSLANEALPLFLDQIVPPYMAVLVSVTLVLVFGEIIPSAVFTGPNQLSIGAAFSPLVKFMMIVVYPVAGPVAWCLDKTLGEEHKGRYNKAEFKALLNLHQYDDTGDVDIETGISGQSSPLDTHTTTGGDGPTGRGEVHHHVQLHSRGGITKEELRMMQGALELHRLKVKDVMTPLDQVAMYSADQVLDSKTLQDIMEKGHSRLPIYQGHPHNVHGMLLVKRLIVLNPEDKVQIGNTDLLEPMICDMDTTLLDMLYEFSTGRSHLAVATDDPERVIQAIHDDKQIPCNIHMAGIITLEDVIERLIKHDIQDESDISVTLQPVLHLPTSSGSKIKIPPSPRGRSIRVNAPSGVLSIKHQPANGVGRSTSAKVLHSSSSQAGKESPSLVTPLLKDASPMNHSPMPVISESSPMSGHSASSSKSKKNPSVGPSTLPPKPMASPELGKQGKKDVKNTGGENDLAARGECKMSSEKWD